MKTEPRIFEIIGDKVKLHRLKTGYTQDELAFMVGLSRPSIINIESGRNGFSIETLLRLCHTLDCDVFNLLPTKEEYKPKIKKISELLKDKRDSEIKRLEEKIAKLKSKPIKMI